MWLFTVWGFYSIAVFRDGRSKLAAVRARRRSHLEQLSKAFAAAFRNRPILYGAANDYPYRVTMPFSVWLKLLDGMAAEQDWSNFKDAAAVRLGRFDDYTDELHHVWQQMKVLESPVDDATEVI